MDVASANVGKLSESVLVALSQRGDRAAFAEIVKRRHGWIRNLMRRLSGDAVLADDLSQQVFLQAWKSIRHVRHRMRFAGWLKQVAVSTWLQHVRKNDPITHSEEYEDTGAWSAPEVALDLDRALATLPDNVRLCIVLSYHERMTHDEISSLTTMPLGTVKSHIRRGTKRLREMLSAYSEPIAGGETP